MSSSTSTMIMMTTMTNTPTMIMNIDTTLASID